LLSLFPSIPPSNSIFGIAGVTTKEFAVRSEKTLGLDASDFKIQYYKRDAAGDFTVSFPDAYIDTPATTVTLIEWSNVWFSPVLKIETVSSTPNPPGSIISITLNAGTFTDEYFNPNPKTTTTIAYWTVR
jgi:hypothetical protein